MGAAPMWSRIAQPIPETALADYSDESLMQGEIAWTYVWSGTLPICRMRTGNRSFWWGETLLRTLAEDEAVRKRLLNTRFRLRIAGSQPLEQQKHLFTDSVDVHHFR